jgi:hypothetical protein
MRPNIARFRNGVLTVLALGVGLSACDDETTGIEDEHFEPAQMQIVLGSEVLVTVGSVGGPVQGELTVVEGDETPHLDVRFLDESGNITEPDEEVSLAVVVDDPMVAGFDQDTPGEFGGHLLGVAEGQTTLVFSVIHGGHADWISAEVPAVVEAAPVAP